MVDDAVRLEVPQGSFVLHRHPVTAGTPLRAWDAADELLLGELGPIDPDAHVAVLNDGFGALAVALAGCRPTSVSDSYVSRLATTANLAANALPADSVAFASSLDPGDRPIDVLLFKVPKSGALLEDQLRRLRPRLATGATVVGGAMSRHIHTSTLDTVATVLGSVTTSRATKKARLIHVTLDEALQPGPAPGPASYEHGGLELLDHAGVFSSGRVDIGTRFLLEHLPAEAGRAEVVDVGCGNGIIGLTLAARDPELVVTLIDESLRAIASTQANIEAAGLGDRAVATVGDGLAEVADDSVDLVISNPPFHQDHAVGDAVAWQMFNDAKRVLRVGGELRIVGNRHLGYHVKLQRVFGNCESVAGNPKFVVLSARKREVKPPRTTPPAD